VSPVFQLYVGYRRINGFNKSEIDKAIKELLYDINHCMWTSSISPIQGDYMAKFLGLIAALAVFSAWLSVVGNPHVVETVIGLVLAAIAGFWVFSKARKFGTPPK